MVTTEDPKAAAIDVEIEDMVWEVEDEPADAPQAEEVSAQTYEETYEEPRNDYTNDYTYEERPARVMNKHIFTWLLSVCFGMYGVDRFFRGQIGLGILKLLTFGGLGFWYLADAGIAIYKSYASGFHDEENLYFDINGNYFY